MKFICSCKDECNQTDCPHAVSHDDCGHACQRVEGARCVMDMASLPVISDAPGTVVAILIPRLRRKA